MDTDYADHAEKHGQSSCFSAFIRVFRAVRVRLFFEPTAEDVLLHKGLLVNRACDGLVSYSNSFESMHFDCGACSTSPQKVNSSNLVRLREKMIREQLEARDVKDKLVLAAMMKVPRHEFVPGDLIDSAYDDCALPLRMGQTISQPYIVGYMTQALELRGTERVLEIGTGSGYQAAILAEIAAEVYTIEILPELGEQAAATLKRLGYKNIHFRIGTAMQDG